MTFKVNHDSMTKVLLDWRKFQIPLHSVDLKTLIDVNLTWETIPGSASSMNACGIFNTASGKSVQVSDSALQSKTGIF